MRYEYLSNFELYSFKVLSVGYSNDTAITRAKCSRDQFIIHYITDGAGYYNGKKIVPGNGFLIPPNHFAEYYADNETPWSMLWIILSSPAYALSKKIYPCDDDFIFPYHFTEYISAVGSEIIKNSPLTYGESNAWDVYNSIISKQISDSTNIKDHENLDYAQFAKRYIDVYYYKAIKISEICDILNLSHSFLYKEFESKYGKSLKNYLTEVKLNQAKQLLLTSKLNISQIGLSIGFEDVLAFSAFFKKHTGVSPSTYKKQFSRNATD
mgnify:CR=1 FL=1